MTDQQTYTDETAQTGLVVAASRDAAFVRTFPLADPGKGVPVMVPTLALLAMIDRAAPEMMRAYLRERSDLIDAPDESLSDSIASFKGETIAAEREVPEADSPEDVDEQPDPIERLRESGRQLGVAWRAFTEGVRAGTFGSDR